MRRKARWRSLRKLRRQERELNRVREGNVYTQRRCREYQMGGTMKSKTAQYAASTYGELQQRELSSTTQLDFLKSGEFIQHTMTAKKLRYYRLYSLVDEHCEVFLFYKNTFFERPSNLYGNFEYGFRNLSKLKQEHQDGSLLYRYVLNNDENPSAEQGKVPITFSFTTIPEHNEFQEALLESIRNWMAWNLNIGDFTLPASWKDLKEHEHASLMKYFPQCITCTRVFYNEEPDTFDKCSQCRRTLQEVKKKKKKQQQEQERIAAQEMKRQQEQ